MQGLGRLEGRQNLGSSLQSIAVCVLLREENSLADWIFHLVGVVEAIAIIGLLWLVSRFDAPVVRQQDLQRFLHQYFRAKRQAAPPSAGGQGQATENSF